MSNKETINLINTIVVLSGLAANRDYEDYDSFLKFLSFQTMSIYLNKDFIEERVRSGLEVDEEVQNILWDRLQEQELAEGVDLGGFGEESFLLFLAQVVFEFYYFFKPLKIELHGAVPFHGSSSKHRH